MTPSDRHRAPTIAAVTEASTSPPILLDDPAVTAALDEHERAEVALIEAKERRDAAVANVRGSLFAAGQRFRDRQEPIPQADLHRLYWDHTELRVSDLATAFGMSKKALAELAGPRAGRAPCESCNRTVAITRSSRTQRPRVQCERCHAAEVELREVQRQREHELDLERARHGNPPMPRHPFWDDRDW